jgi:hypothetical protein
MLGVELSSLSGSPQPNEEHIEYYELLFSVNEQRFHAQRISLRCETHVETSISHRWEETLIGAFETCESFEKVKLV